VLSYDGTPERFVRAAARTSPSTIVRVLDPGHRVIICALAGEDLPVVNDSPPSRPGPPRKCPVCQPVTSGTRRDELPAMRVCVALLFATACTHHHRVTTLPPTSPSATTAAQLGATGASADMRNYTTISRGRGAVEGLALGGAGGAAIGAVIGLASGDDTCARDSFCILRFSAGDKAVFGAIGLGSLGLGLGALIGAVAGSRDVYELDSALVPRVSTTIAPGRAGGALSWSF
jgi:hypothetical protein